MFSPISLCRSTLRTPSVISTINSRSLSGITKFDTRKFVQTLQDKGGFSEKQAEVAVNVVNAAINDGYIPLLIILLKRNHYHQ